jgi:hypothetical protein
MDDTWIREPGDPEEARPMAQPEGVPHDDPQEGFLVRDDDDVPDAAKPLHPDLGGPVGPS